MAHSIRPVVNPEDGRAAELVTLHPVHPRHQPRSRRHVKDSIKAMRQRNNNSYIRYKIFIFQKFQKLISLISQNEISFDAVKRHPPALRCQCVADIPAPQRVFFVGDYSLAQCAQRDERIAIKDVNLGPGADCALSDSVIAGLGYDNTGAASTREGCASPI
jgi:hypothetical protein